MKARLILDAKTILADGCIIQRKPVYSPLHIWRHLESCMTDDELKESWPELGIVVAELRLAGQNEVAEKLVDTFLSGSTSSEIVGQIALVLRDHHALRAQLSDPAQNAWDAIMADVCRAFRGSKFALWLARLSR